jgi:hypothetical protein
MLRWRGASRSLPISRRWPKRRSDRWLTPDARIAAKQCPVPLSLSWARPAGSVVRISELCFTGGRWLGRFTLRQNPALRPVNRSEVFSRFAAGRPGHRPEPAFLTAYQPPPRGEKR